MTMNRNWFSTFEVFLPEKYVQGGNRQSMKALGKGIVNIEVIVNGPPNPSTECSQCTQVVSSQDVSHDLPVYGNVEVPNSSDINLGNESYYRKPLTINQVTPISNGEAKIDESVDNRSPQQKGAHWFQRFIRQHIIAILFLTAVLLLSLMAFWVVLLIAQKTSPEDSDEENSTSCPASTTEVSTATTEFRLISRKKWLAETAKAGVMALKLPVAYVFIIHTGSPSCSTENTCAGVIRGLQQFHMQGKGWSDIGYSFLVGGDGNAYEGRGWYSVGSQVTGSNAKSIGIAFVGNFEEKSPPLHQLQAAQELIKIGLKLNAISPNYKLLAIRQILPTTSPGKALFNIIKTWEHWSENA
ncbi:N-acetylmuramoyl-L-alanine amidase-like isoform X2 [Photinus pyralis]|nr:N-acetylmuramoyl-L-alanine amidase-like isoform X2 [Photinus pyralis]